MTKLWMDHTRRFLILLVFVTGIDAIRVRGQWDTSQRLNIVSKFGFQESTGIIKYTRGFVYGNITSGTPNANISKVVFAIVPESKISSMQTESNYPLSCGLIMQELSQVAFHRKCWPQADRGDFIRWIPCPKGELCQDEDEPTNVIDNFQMTIQVEEPKIAEYWYVVLTACELNDNCTWVSTKEKMTIDYDLWLTNGKPGTLGGSIFTLQFSFDEENTLEIYVVSLTMYLLLSAISHRALLISKTSQPPQRLLLLSYAIYIKTFGVLLQTVNLVIFAVDGEGLIIARFVGEVLRLASIDLFILVLLLLARGWGFTTNKLASRKTLTAWSVFAGLHVFFFLCNFIFVYDALHEIDIFTSWPGYGILFIRLTFAFWFLFQIRRLIRSEQSEERAEFMAHMGAGFLVWFFHLPGLGLIASFISALWRFKVILGITTFANYTAMACLLHLFWPTGSYRKFFVENYWSHRRMGRVDSNEMQDYERLLFEGISDSDSDCPDLDPNVNLQSI